MNYLGQRITDHYALVLKSSIQSPNRNRIFVISIQCFGGCSHGSFIFTLKIFKNNRSVHFACLHQHRCAHFLFLVSSSLPQIQILVPYFFLLPLSSQNASKIEQYENLISNGSSMHC